MNALASMPIPHTNDNRQIMQSMQPQAPIPKVPTDIPTVKPISTPHNATITEPSHKLTTSVVESSKREPHHKQQASQLHKAVPPTSPTICIRTRAQVSTAAAQVAPPSSNTRSCMQHSGVPPPTCQPGYTAAVMKQQRQQRRHVQLTHRITRLENEVHLAMAVMEKDMGKLLNYRQLMNSPKYKKTWSLSAVNKFRQLANVIGGRIKNPTNSIEFISEHKIPADCRKNIQYWQFLCLVRPKKAELRFTVGSNRINYPGKVATPIAEMLGTKMLFNSVISTKAAWIMTMDISNFYLMIPLHRAKFIWIKLSNIPNEVIREYKLGEKATKNRSIYIRAKRGIYGLPQAGLLANKLLKKRLNKHGYRQSKLVPGLWKHDTRPI